MSQFLQPSIILLKEGTDTSQGTAQLISNINAVQAVSDIVRTTLGPCGMDKLICEEGNKITISNDGATIIKLLDIVHPAARTLVDIAKSQDEEVGDGTTSVVILAGELLTEAKKFIEDGVHPTLIIKGLRKACALAKQKVNEIAVNIQTKNEAERRQMLERCAATAMASKLISSHAEFFAKMVVEAVLRLEQDMDINMLGIKKESGGSLQDSMFLDGVAFKKTFSYAGFEQQPKSFDNPKILLLNIELELKREKDNAEIRIDNPEDYQRFVDAEWKIIYNKLDTCVKSGANIVLSRLAIGDLATQYFADHGIFCAGRVPDEDLRRVSKASGAQIITTLNDFNPNVLGTVGHFEERQVGSQRYNLFSKCPHSKTATIILRGGGEQFLDEAERSIHDAIMVVRRTAKYNTVVAGGGALEMEVSSYLREQAKQFPDKQQNILAAFAKALESIPRQLAQNAGLDSIDILAQLRKKHAEGGKWFGVDLTNGGVTDTFNTFVWEPALVKLNCFEAATEAACLILSVDETINAKAGENKV